MHTSVQMYIVFGGQEITLGVVPQESSTMYFETIPSPC